MWRLWVKVLGALCCVLLAGATAVYGQEAPGPMDGPTQASAPIERQEPAANVAVAKEQPAAPEIPVTPYDPNLFSKRTQPADLQFLKEYDGAPANDVLRDKRFKHVLHDATPNVMFHYGRDKSLSDAMDEVLSGSSVRVRVRDARYVTIAGAQGQYLAGRGFVWVDMQDGIVLGGFYFHPTNGEPTPTLTVFSRQVKEDTLEASQLPPAFLEDMERWQMSASVPLVLTRYFIGDVNEKILLEHNEDFCSMSVGRPGDDCMQMEADAADADVTAAVYLEQVHYATNATAWMLNDPDQAAWIGVRDRTCGRVLDPLACHVRMTHERIRVIERHPVRRR